MIMTFSKFLWQRIISSLSLLLIFSGCIKEDGKPDNPYNGRTKAVFNQNLTYGTMTDQEGNIYRTIQIDTMTWMAENLRTSIYNDETKIPVIIDKEEWANATTDACCTYNNTENVDTIATYGRLYNWFAVGTGKLAPEGWHVATDKEWWALTKYYGDRPFAGGYLKEAGTDHWKEPNNGATNKSGFTALPSGCRFEDGQFSGMGQSFHCWRSEKYLDIYGINWYLTYASIFSAWAFHVQPTGFSVRCVKD
jgi:uncharacterized protein (TIGR02145 family)